MRFCLVALSLRSRMKRAANVHSHSLEASPWAAHERGEGRSGMPDLPTGTVTLLFIEVAESTGLMQQLGEHYTELLIELQLLLREKVLQQNGHEVNIQGDGSLVA